MKRSKHKGIGKENSNELLYDTVKEKTLGLFLVRMKRNQYVGTSHTASCSPLGFSCNAKIVL
jgi:hypothetical protein